MTEAAAKDVAWTLGLLCLTGLSILVLSVVVIWVVDVVFTVETLTRWVAEITA